MALVAFPELMEDFISSQTGHDYSAAAVCFSSLLLYKKSGITLSSGLHIRNEGRKACLQNLSSQVSLECDILKSP